MIRTTSINDVPVLSELNKDVQDLHHRLFPDKFKPYNQKEIKNLFLEFFNTDNIVILIDETEDCQATGYLVYEVRTYDENFTNFAYQSLYIRHITVSKEFQGKGIGTQLVDEVKARAKNQNIPYVELDVFNHNGVACSFFESKGFKSVNTKMSFEV